MWKLVRSGRGREWSVTLKIPVELKVSFPALLSVSGLWFQAFLPLPCQGSWKTASDPFLFIQNYHGYNLQKSITIRVTKKEEFTLKTTRCLTPGLGSCWISVLSIVEHPQKFCLSAHTYSSQWLTPFVHRCMPVFLWAPCWGTWPARAPKKYYSCSHKQWFVFLFLSQLQFLRR